MHLEMGDAKERSPSRPMKCYRNYLINCRDLLNLQLDSTGKHHMGDLNCDLLSETISKSKHLVRLIHVNTHAEYHGLTQVIKEATRTTAETNTLTYYIVTNKRTILLTVVLFLVALVIIAPKT